MRSLHLLGLLPTAPTADEEDDEADGTDDCHNNNLLITANDEEGVEQVVGVVHQGTYTDIHTHTADTYREEVGKNEEVYVDPTAIRLRVMQLLRDKVADATISTTDTAEVVG